MGKIINFPKKNKRKNTIQKFESLTDLQELIEKIRQEKSKSVTNNDWIDKYKELENKINNKPDNKFNSCMSPSHNPPMCLYIPPGETHIHTCPDCGQKAIMRGSNITFCVK